MKATRRQTRDLNTRLVLQAIYRGNGGATRAAIARATRLTRPTVSTIVSDLLARQLVVETGRGPSAGGKPPTLLAVNADAYQLLCLDISSRVFRGALLNLRGFIQMRHQLAVEGRTGESAAERVFDLAESLLSRATAPILGLGVGTPGLTNVVTGEVRQAVNLGWEGLPLGTMLAARFGHPVHVANDSDLAALGEYLFGQTGSSDHLVVVKVGQGVGAGIVLDGRPLAGDGFAAGEIGHVVVDPAGPRCQCGNRGCLETIASAPALLRVSGAPAWPVLVAGYQAGERVAARTIDAAAEALGAALGHLIAVFNIRHIVLAGRIVDLGPRFLSAVRAAAAKRALPTMVSETTIGYSTLGRDIVILGCSAVVLQRELGIK